GILLTFRPHLVIGVGGYASGPVLAMAVLLRRVTVLQEQNAYPGLTNRLLGRYVRLAFVPVEGLERFFPRPEVVGNPVRADILRLREEPPTARPEPMVLVFGGSQGARRINEAMVGALPLLGKVSGPVSILHQTGSADLEEPITKSFLLGHDVSLFLLEKRRDGRRNRKPIGGHFDVMLDRFGHDGDVHLSRHALYDSVWVKDAIHPLIVVHVKNDCKLAYGAGTGSLLRQEQHRVDSDEAGLRCASFRCQDHPVAFSPLDLRGLRTNGLGIDIAPLDRHVEKRREKSVVAFFALKEARSHVAVAPRHLSVRSRTNQPAR
ncbi:MAG: glycosyltransferase, partial [Planctomycetes bacterium]|nr:glycosyltransferase [Planctomycetota bacterium]